jgi:PAS domain S-box-containing protein
MEHKNNSNILDERTLKFLDALNVGFIHMDMDFGILEVNEVSLRWFGYSRREVVGHHTSEFMSEEDFQRLKRIDLALLRQKRKYYQFEFDGPNKQGEKNPYLVSISLELDDEGRPVSTYVLLADIREQKMMQARLRERESELQQIRQKLRRDEMEARMIGVGDAMKKVWELILRCADVESSILILGETGVGKEMAAREIHAQSRRREKPFVAVNCGAIPEPLLESELFGHKKGAFTGAIASHPGLFREAEGGTLFLDEVGDLNLSLQVKLLRAFQEKEVRPVGGSHSYPLDVRLITATHHNLRDLVEQSLFREDLYYRIAVIPVLIPPLRERREDILPLTEHFISKHSKKNETGVKKLSHAAQRMLLDYSWPGNVRELENCIEHALAMSRGSLLKSTDFPVTVVDNRKPGPKESPPGKQTGETRQNKALFFLKPWELEERKAMEEALLRHKGNRGAAAKDLGISRSTLWRKIRLYQLEI